MRTRKKTEITKSKRNISLDEYLLTNPVRPEIKARLSIRYGEKTFFSTEKWKEILKGEIDGL